jgi:hypothetical protein
MSALIFSGTAFATPIPYLGSGLLNFSAFSVLVTGNPQTGCINFYNSAVGACGTPATFSVVQPVDTSVFPASGTNNAGAILGVPGGVTAETGFITTSGNAGPVGFDLLNFVPQNTTTPCTANTTSGNCVVAGSPFMFSLSDASDITVIFSVDLCGYVNGSGGGSSCSNGSLYTGQFTAPFDGYFVTIVNGVQMTEPVTISNLLDAAAAGGITDGVTAQLAPITGAPEPGTSFLLGAGLIGLGLLGSRRKRA